MTEISNLTLTPEQLAAAASVQQGQPVKTDTLYDPAILSQIYTMSQNAVFPTEPGKLFSQDQTTTKEKERIASRLSGFNPKDNMVWHEITQRFGASIKQPELLSIATVLAQNANIKLDRDAKRRKSVLIKWFEENWAAIHPYLDYVVLEDSHGQH